MENGMFIVWGMAALYLTIGSIWMFPRLHKIIKCKGKTTGRIVGSKSTHGEDRALKGYFEYYVDGVRYEANTGYSKFIILIRNRDYVIHYNPDNPQESYFIGSGIIYNLIIGIAFFGAGIFVVICGIILKFRGF